LNITSVVCVTEFVSKETVGVESHPERQPETVLQMTASGAIDRSAQRAQVSIAKAGYAAA
jgi:hypothetical protein